MFIFDIYVYKLFKNMIKLKLLLATFFILYLASSCSVQKHYICSEENSNISKNFKEEINKDILEVFYQNDTVGISKTIYLLK